MGLMYAVSFFVLFTVGQCASGGRARPRSAEERAGVMTMLKQRIPYNTVRPDGAGGPESPAVVSIGYSPLRFLDVDEERGSLRTTGYLMVSWTDSRLSYSGLSPNFTIRMYPDTIWTPDIALYDTDSPGIELLNPNEPLAVISNGHVLLIPYVAFTVFCEPMSANGTIRCSFTLGSWTYHGQEVDLTVGDQVDLDSVKPGPWRVQSATAQRRVNYYSCCPQSYPSIEYTFVLARTRSG